MQFDERAFSCRTDRANVWRVLSIWVGIAAAVILQGCASLAPVDKVASNSIPLRADTTLGVVAAQSVADDATAFRALPVSAFSMDARVTLIRAAQNSLDLQYYLLQDDATGRSLLREVRDAAARGVRVRVLVDDLYTAHSAQMLRGLSAYDNIEVRLFNPFPAGRGAMLTRWAFSLFDFARVNHRMHNKMLIADAAFAVAGGRNIADEYFYRSDSGNFIDFDLLLAGRAVADLAVIFDRYWNSQRVYPMRALDAIPSDASELRADFERLTRVDDAPRAALSPEARDVLGYAPLSGDLAHPPLRMLRGRVQVFADDPEKVSGRSDDGSDPGTVTARAMSAFGAAQSQLTLASPYFVPGELGMQTLRGVRSRNVAATVITNSLAASDEPFASAAYSRYRKDLLRLGIDVYEITSKPLQLARRYGGKLASIGRSHAKIAVMDRHVTFLGSMNMDFRSSRTNTELGMLIESDELAQQVCGLLEELAATDAFRLGLEQPGDRLTWTIKNGDSNAVYHDEPDVSPATRLEILLFSPLVPEGML
jgi:cardiolipin synthase C